MYVRDNICETTQARLYEHVGKRAADDDRMRFPLHEISRPMNLGGRLSAVRFASCTIPAVTE